MKVTIYHNPKCSTSRKVLGFMREKGIEPEIIEYLKDPPSKERLTELLREMEITPQELLRTKEQLYKDLGLKSATDAEAIEAMLAHPILIERPIVEVGEDAILCRPPERVFEILAKAQ